MKDPKELLNVISEWVQGSQDEGVVEELRECIETLEKTLGIFAIEYALYQRYERPKYGAKHFADYLYGQHPLTRDGILEMFRHAYETMSYHERVQHASGEQSSGKVSGE